MKGPLIIRLWAVMLAALFVFGQMTAQAHTAEHGPDHDHDGVACAVSVLGEDQAPMPVPPETDVPDVAPVSLPVLPPAYAVRFKSTHPGRAPPPRAPPR